MDRNIRLTVAALAALMIVVGVGFLLVVAPRLGQQTQEMMRDDITGELETLRILEKNVKAFDGQYLACGTRAAAEATLAAGRVGVSEDACWAKLGFKAERRAVYWVESDGSTFTAFARFDIDNDGKAGEAHLGPAGAAVADGF
jgi:hypothetical protein